MASEDESNSSSGLSPQALQEAERGDASQSEDQPAEQEQSQLQSNGFVKNGLDRFAQKQLKTGGLGKFLSSGALTGGALIGTIAGGAVIMVGLAILLFALIGPLKQVHFATVLRSAGLVRFTYEMNRQYSRIAINSVVGGATNEGLVKVQGRSLTDVMTKVDPAKQLKTLGREGSLRFNANPNGSLKSLEINGKVYTLDAFSSNGNYAKANPLEKMRARSAFAEAVKSGLADRLALENRAFRSSVYKGIRGATGIKLVTFADKAKEWRGKSANDAKKLTQDLKKQKITGSKALRSSLPVLEEVLNESDPAERDKKLSNLSERLKTAGDASIVVLVSTVACIAHDLNDSFKAADKDLETQKIRLAADVLTTSDQIKSGDVVGEAVGAENSLWDGAENSYFYKQATQQETTLSDYDQLASVPSSDPTSPIRIIVEGLDTGLNQAGIIGVIKLLPESEAKQAILDTQNMALDGACAVLLNEAVQWTIAGVEIGVSVVGSVASLGSGAAAIAAVKVGLAAAAKGGAILLGSVAAGNFIGSLLDTSIANATAFTGTETGTGLANNSFVALEELQSTSSRQMNYGAPLTVAEADQATSVALTNTKVLNAEKSFTERYFAVTNPNSLGGLIAAKIPTSATSTAQTAASGIGSLLSLPTKLIGSLFSGSRTYADTPVTSAAALNGNSWGWTEEELDRLDTDPDFQPAALETFMANNESNPNFAVYESCFNPALQYDVPDACYVPGFLKTDEALKWRAYNTYIDKAECLAADDLCVVDSYSGNTVSGDAQSLAKQIIASGNLSDYQGDGGDKGPKEVAQIQAIADGTATPECQVDLKILTMLASLTKSHKVSLSDLNRTCSKSTLDYSTGGHWEGQAIDIDSIDGQEPQSNVAILNEILTYFPEGSTVKFGQPEFRGGTGKLTVPSGITLQEFNGDSNTHQHIQVFP